MAYFVAKLKYNQSITAECLFLLSQNLSVHLFVCCFSFPKDMASSGNVPCPMPRNSFQSQSQRPVNLVSPGSTGKDSDEGVRRKVGFHFTCEVEIQETMQLSAFLSIRNSIVKSSNTQYFQFYLSLKLIVSIENQRY